MFAKSTLLFVPIWGDYYYYYIAHRQTQGRRFGEPNLRCAEFPSDEQALYGHAVDGGADGFGRGVEPVVARDGRIYHARPPRGT